MKKREGIKLAGLDIQRLYRIEAAELEFSGKAGVVEVTGKNKAGKTSLLRSILALLGGGKAIAEDPRNDKGGGTSISSGRFTNGYTITRRPTPANPKGNLIVEAPDGGKHGQTLVSSWLGNGAFDLHALRKYATKPKELVPILLSIATDPDLPAKLRDVRRSIEGLKDERSPWYSAKQRSERTKRPDGSRPEPVDVSAEAAKLDELRSIGEERAGAIFDADVARGAADEAGRNVERQRNHIDGLEEDLEQIKREIADAKEGLEAVEATKKTADEVAAELEEKAQGFPDPSEEIAEVRDRLADADARNAELDPWKDWDRAQEELEEARAMIAGYNSELEELKTKERDLLAKSGVDIPGLSFDEEGLPLLHGRPLDAASGREWVEFSAAVAFAHDPELRVALVDEAEGVDADGMEALAELAREKDFQLFLCRINPAGVGEVVVCDDGKAWVE